MPKKVKKKVRLKIIPILFLILIAAFIYLIFKYSNYIKIKNIYIYGNRLVTDQEIIDLAEIDDYPSFINTKSRDIKDKIKQNELIKDVKVKKKLISKLEIYIEEHEPIFIMNDKIVLEDNSKIDQINIKLPVVEGINEDNIYHEFLEEFKKIDVKIRSLISEIKYDTTEYDSKRFLLYMDDGNHIYVNINNLEKLKYYEEIYTTLNNKKGTLYLDSGNHFEVFKKENTKKDKK